ncbi:MAG: DUF4402 domain-containing protein [Acidobacteriota bacterium]
MRAINILGLASLVILLGSAAMASPTATSNASATIVNAISISNTAAMNFADVAPGASDGTVILSTTGGRTATGGVTLSSAASASAAAFTVTGDSGATYAITLPSSITLSDGASHSMTVDTFVSNPDSTGTLTGGSEALTVGATLHVTAAQATGSYSGQFDVTVAYN